MEAARSRRGARPNRLHARSLLVFAAALTVQGVILFSSLPGSAQQDDPIAPLCVANCPSISVQSSANIFVSGVYTTTYTIDLNPITKTLFTGELGGGAEFAKIFPNQGKILGTTGITYTWSVDDPILPLVMTTTVIATEPGFHEQSFGRNITETRIADVEMLTFASETPPPFRLDYKIPALVSVGAITDTITLLPLTDVITDTISVVGNIGSMAGRYGSVVGSGLSFCETTDLTFECAVPKARDFHSIGITMTLLVENPGELIRDLEVSGGGTKLPIRFASRTHPLQAAIDIKPGGTPNTIRVGVPHNIPVAILSTATLAADEIDVNTLEFGPTGSETGPTSCAPQHANADALPDLVCHFDGPKAGFQSGDVVGRLTGKTLPTAASASGLPFAAQDSVRIIKPGQGSGPN